MKIIFLLAFLPALCFAQVNPTAGDELMKARNHYQLGAAMTIGGALVSAIPAFVDSMEFETEMRAAGGVFAFIGIILTIESFGHVGKAGRLLNDDRVGLYLAPTAVRVTFALRPKGHHPRR